MSKITAKIKPDKTVEVHIDLPSGEECDAAYEAFCAVLAILGAGIEKSDDAPAGPPIPHSAPRTIKTSGGG